MGTDAPMATATETPAGGLLTLSQWLSPGFPVSGFAYSGGLETAVADGTVAGAEAVEGWARTVLLAGGLRNDAILLGLTLRGAERDATLAGIAEALAGSAERWRETRDQGTAFADTLASLGGQTIRAAYPVALGVAARRLGLLPSVVVTLFLQAQIANIASAAIRLVPIGQAAAQGVIAALAAEVEAVAEAAVSAGLDDLGGAALGADLAAMRHETQEVRLFRS